MIVAGEPSGDAHAAKLVRALADALPEMELELFGSAGVRMREAGVEALVEADHLSIVGLSEIARAFPMFLGAYRKLLVAAEIRKPAVAVLVDFPEFNLKLAKSLKRRGIKVVYYISPQLWAWRKYRRRTIRDHVDLLLTILPFEKDWYDRFGIKNVEYVGSPLVREVTPSVSREQFISEYSLTPERPVVALLPGSRHKEITRILPEMLKAASILEEQLEGSQFVIALASNRSLEEVEDATKAASRAGYKAPENVVVVPDRPYDVLNAADVAAVTSGTATLEAGIIGVPMAIVYKTSRINYKLLRPLIKVDHFGLINLIAGKRVAAEMIQDDLTPARLAEELRRLLEPEANLKTREDLKAAVQKLGTGGASRRAGKAILELINADLTNPK